MYLDKPLRDHNLLQAIARTNRPSSVMEKLTGRGRRLLRCVRQPREGTQLRREHPRGVADRLGSAEGDGPRRSRSLHGAIRGHYDRGYAGVPAGGALTLADPEVAKTFEQNFKSSRTPLGSGRARPVSLSSSVTSTTGSAGSISRIDDGNGAAKDTYGELSAKTRELIEENTDVRRHRRSASGVQDRQGLRHEARRAADAGGQGRSP